MRNKNSTEQRFTIIEMLAVMAIIAVLMALSLGLFSYANRAMSDSKCKSMIAKIEVAQEAYKAKTGYYLPQYYIRTTHVLANAFYMDDPLDGKVDFTDFLPDYEKMKESMKEEEVEWADGTDDTKFCLEDPYGLHFIYRNPGVKNTTTFDLQSKGVDTNDEADDITNY